jgi:hypothetical protein
MRKIVTSIKECKFSQNKTLKIVQRAKRWETITFRLIK